MSKISFVESIDGTRLFSFHRHDYKDYIDDKGNYMSIDGGFDYNKYAVDSTGEYSWLRTLPISEVINDIREQYKWTQVLDANGDPLDEVRTVLLKDMEDVHIASVLQMLIDTSESEEDTTIIDTKLKAVIIIFLAELKLRLTKPKIANG